MKLSEVGACIRHLIFPKKTTVEDIDHPYWAEERFLRRLLEDIVYEELLSKERTSLTVEQLMKSDAEQTRALVGDRKPSISSAAGTGAVQEEDDFDADVELLTSPASAPVKKPFQHDAPQVSIPSYREKELLEDAKEKSRTMNELDVNTFCLLCNRIIAEVE
jgi:hypothetical protein